MSLNVLTFCVFATFIQTITSQCLRNSLPPAYPAATLINDVVPLGGACGTGLAASNGGGLSVTSASPLAPMGLVVTSENAMEGQVAVGGQLPLLGSVAMDAAFPSVGAGAVSYACGDGSLGIVNESPIAAVPVTAVAAPPAIIASTPAMTAAAIAPAIANPVPALASPVLGSSFRFGPGKSPFSGPPFAGPTNFGSRNPVGRGCGFRF